MMATTAGRNLVVAIYSHPEYYPPTLSALENLSPLYERIIVVHGNISGFDWKYPDNVTLVGPEERFPAGTVELQPLSKKIAAFIRFTKTFRSMVKTHRADTVLIYDTMPVLSWRLISKTVNKPKFLWYHNHDVIEAAYTRKYSLAWWAWKSHRWLFQRLTIFSLPAQERKEQFPMNKLRGGFFFLPNFPSMKIYGTVSRSPLQAGQTVRLLFQGSIGPLHGLEEIIPLLGEAFDGHPVELVLKGFVQPDYLEKLKKLAVEAGQEHKIIYIRPTGYREVIKNAATCHIGIGIHRKQDIMNQTLGTASNKIYEYAASGLLVLLNDNPHFRQTLEKYAWVAFTDSSRSSLKRHIGNMIKSWDSFSADARHDFLGDLSFEHYFKPVREFLETGN